MPINFIEFKTLYCKKKQILSKKFFLGEILKNIFRSTGVGRQSSLVSELISEMQVLNDN